MRRGRNDWSLVRYASYRFRTTLRSRLGNYATIVLVVGVIGGLAMGAIVAARRTQSAYPAALAATNASDLQFQSYVGGCPTYSACLYSPSFTRQIERLPHVRHVAGLNQTFVAPVGRNGRPYLPTPLANNIVDSVAAFGGETVTQDRVIAEQGRIPNPDRPDEFAVTPQAAALLGFHVGQVVPMVAYTFKQVFNSSIGLPSGRPLVHYDMRLVGIVTFENSVVHDEVDRYPTYELFTAALDRRLIAGQAAGFPQYAITLDSPKYLAAVERRLIGFLPRKSAYQFHVTSVDEGEVERATKPESIALGTFGAIGAIAALVIASQAIGRAIRRNQRDLVALRAVGASPSMIVADSLFGTLLAVLAGSILAAIVGLAFTPLSPIGAVRQLDPSPGLDFDWAILAGGFAIILAALSLTAASYSWIAMRRTVLGSVDQASPGSSRVVDAAARFGFPPSALAGIRFAIVRSRGRDAAPVPSAFVGAALAVAVLVTTVTFSSGLSTLVSRPNLYGWNWNYAIDGVTGNSVPGALSNQLLSNDKYVESWTGYGFANFQVDGLTVPGMLTSDHAPISPPILTGHSVAGTDQIVLGGATLAELHRRVGQWVIVSYGDKKDAPVYVPPTRVQIVGTATFPAIGASGTLHPSMGAGALIERSIAPPAMQRAIQSSDPLQRGQAVVVIRLRKYAPPGAALASLQRITNTITEKVRADPASGGGTFVLLSVQQPAEIVNYKTIGSTPVALAAALAVAAALALGLTLVSSVRRRRRDLALLKALGFVRRQIAAVVFWQASIAALIGVAIGVPLGIVLGRTLWTQFARQIYAVPLATIPGLQVLLIVVGALILANIVGFLPGRVAAETKVAPSLRTE